MRLYLATTSAGSCPTVLHALGYPYRLASYHALCQERVREQMLLTVDDGSEWIMDSGLFSFMFGGAQDKFQSFDDYRRYANEYVEAMHQWGWKHPIVECDVQRVLSPEDCQRLREEVFDQSGFEVMYVWHLPDKIDTLRQLATERSYIGLSIPELRQVFGTGNSLKRVVLRLMREIEGTKAKVHLLGNAENQLLPLKGFSSDTSSWSGSARWGKGHKYDFHRGKQRFVVIHTQEWRDWMQVVKQSVPGSFELLWTVIHDKKPEEQFLYECAMCSAYSMWLMMQKVSGQAERQLEPPEALNIDWIL